MEHWWKRNSNLILNGDKIRGGYTKDQVEDQTGCIPLFNKGRDRSGSRCYEEGVGTGTVIHIGDKKDSQPRKLGSVCHSCGTLE